MKYMTRDFGELDIAEENIIEFVQPPFGFEEYKKYTLIYDEEIGGNMAWMQSLESRAICFILVDPSSLAPDFAPRLPGNIEGMLGDGEYVCWVVAVIPEDFKKTTVNLKSPIIVNPHTRRGAQVILEQDYSVQFPLMKGAE